MRNFFEQLLTNPGKKIKSYSITSYMTLVILTTIVATIFGLGLLNIYWWILFLLPLIAALAFVLSLILGLIPHVFLYGIGELIENVQRITSDMSKITNPQDDKATHSNTPPKEYKKTNTDYFHATKNASEKSWVCSCGARNQDVANECSVCFKKRPTNTNK